MQKATLGKRNGRHFPSKPRPSPSAVQRKSPSHICYGTGCVSGTLAALGTPIRVRQKSWDCTPGNFELTQHTISRSGSEHGRGGTLRCRHLEPCSNRFASLVLMMMLFQLRRAYTFQYRIDHFLLGLPSLPRSGTGLNHVPDMLITHCTHHANFLRSWAVWTAYSALVNVSDCPFRTGPGSLFCLILKTHSWIANITSNFSGGKTPSPSNAKARHGSSRIELGSPHRHPGQPRS